MNEQYRAGFRQMRAWRESHALVLSVYKETTSFPASEQYGITSQLRRAASSIAAQVVEGSRMPTQAHRKLYYDRAYASSSEVDYFLELARDLGYLEQNAYVILLRKLNHVGSLLYKLSKSCIP